MPDPQATLMPVSMKAEIATASTIHALTMMCCPACDVLLLQGKL
jgi:hypothetical protein